MKLTKHEIAEKILFLNGSPLILSEYKPFHILYDLGPTQIIPGMQDNIIRDFVYKTGRQVAKSTTLANTQILSCNYINAYKIIYAAPLKEHVYRYSSVYLKRTIMGSPMIKCNMDKDSAKSMLCKTFKNSSMITLTYTSLNSSGDVERARGIPSDENDLDEYQDLPEALLYVIEQCMGASKYCITKRTGTPKTLSNPIELSWRKSCQYECVIKCLSCNHDNIPIEPEVWDMIKEPGLSCAKCGKIIDPLVNSTWVPMVPSKKDTYVGVHIPQFIMPFHLTKQKWAKLYHFFLTYPRVKFANEIAGLSFDTGGQLISMTELESLIQIEHKDKIEVNQYTHLAAGIDWSGGGTELISYTTISIVGMKLDGTIHSLFNKRLLEKDPMEQVEIMVDILKKWEIKFCGCDWGMGHASNDQLRRRWCPMSVDRVVEYQYSNMNSLIKWNIDAKRYMLSKSQSIALLFIELRNKGILFTNNMITREQVFSDILAEYEDVIETPGGSKKIYRRNASYPDDILHSLNFAIITLKRIAGKLLVEYTNDKKVAEEEK